MSDDGQKWQHAYQTLLLSNENRDSGIVSQLGSSPTSSRMSSRDPDVRSVDSSGVRDSSILDDSVHDDLPDQVSAFWSFGKEDIGHFDSFPQLADVRSELESLKQQFDAIQKEKKSLESEFDELKENYSLLSSQSKTVSGAWFRSINLSLSALIDLSLLEFSLNFPSIKHFISIYCCPAVVIHFVS